MAILEKTVWITLNPTNISYYEDNGYTIDRIENKRKKKMVVQRGTRIEVLVGDLPNKSNVKVIKICDFCNVQSDKPQPYCSILECRNSGDGKDRCVKCSKIKAIQTKMINMPIEDSLGYRYPSLSSEWNKELNENNPFEISYGSTTIVWWNCPKNKDHIYDTSVNNRTNGNKNCPYCSSKRVNDTNSLAMINKDLASEWHPTLNGDLTPNDFTSKSGEKVWWIGKCGHKWKASISHRANGRCCPECNESKGEKAIHSYLLRKQYNIEPQYTFNDLIGVGGGLLKFDFAILSLTNSLKCLVEYDGEFHYEQIYKDDGHETILIHDKLKNKYCLENNIPLIRIPYWDFDNIENILEQKLNLLFETEAS